MPGIKLNYEHIIWTAWTVIGIAHKDEKYANQISNIGIPNEWVIKTGKSCPFVIPADSRLSPQDERYQRNRKELLNFGPWSIPSSTPSSVTVAHSMRPGSLLDHYIHIMWSHLHALQGALVFVVTVGVSTIKTFHPLVVAHWLTDWWITNAELYYILGWSVYTIQQYVAGLVKWVVRWCTEDDKVKKSGSVCLLTECLPEKRHARTSLHVLSLSYHLTLNRNSPSRVAARNWTVCGWRIKHRLL